VKRQRPLAVHIDRIVLDEAVLGGARWDARTRLALRSALQSVLQQELAAGLAPAELDRLAAGGALARLPAGELRLATGTDAASLGRGLGTQIAAALKPEPPR
jgi:hypothetical protein